MDIKMKKLLALLLAGALLTVGLASCSKKNADKDDRDASYVEDEVVVNDVRLESVDADGNAQKDENGLRIYEYFRFETIDDETVELVSFRSEVLGSAAGETPSYLPCYTPHTVVIPATLGGKTVTNIGASAFKQRTEITAVVIPDTVAVIGNYAFDECDALTAVSLPVRKPLLENRADLIICCFMYLNIHRLICERNIPLPDFSVICPRDQRILLRGTPGRLI